MSVPPLIRYSEDEPNTQLPSDTKYEINVYHVTRLLPVILSIKEKRNSRNI